MTSSTDPNRIPADAIGALHHLVDAYRSRCLWFLRPDYYPRHPAEIRRVLGWIEAHGDVEAFQRAADIRQWLSRSSNGKSAAS